jgi:hypothetical protein
MDSNEKMLSVKEVASVLGVGQQADTARRTEGGETAEDGRAWREPNLPRARVDGQPHQDRQHDVSGRARNDPGPSYLRDRTEEA